MKNQKSFKNIVLVAMLMIPSLILPNILTIKESTLKSFEIKGLGARSYSFDKLIAAFNKIASQKKIVAICSSSQSAYVHGGIYFSRSACINHHKSVVRVDGYESSGFKAGEKLDVYVNGKKAGTITVPSGATQVLILEKK